MNLFKYLLSLPKTIIFNLKVFPLAVAIKMPCFLHYRTQIGPISKNCIEFHCKEIKSGMIKFGCGMGSKGVFEGEYPKATGGGYIHVKPSCKLIFHGPAFFAGGFSLRVDNGGTIEFGENFGCNSYCFIAANKLIRFGDDCTLGWNVKIRDTDGHKIFCLDDLQKKQINVNKEVIIGDHVWIAANVNILKGTCIPNDCVVAYGTLLTGQKNSKNNTIIGGNPPSVLKEDLTWYF